MMRECIECEQELPTEKFNPESYSPEVCFRCRVSGVSFGYTTSRQHFHGDDLVGGTIASDNRNTLALAREQGHDPVPLKNGEGSFVPTKGQNDRLKTTLLGQKKTAALV